jgi:hypothetical protein
MDVTERPRASVGAGADLPLLCRGQRDDTQFRGLLSVCGDLNRLTGPAEPPRRTARALAN